MNLKNIILLLCALNYNPLAFGMQAERPTDETDDEFTGLTEIFGQETTGDTAKKISKEAEEVVETENSTNQTTSLTMPQQLQPQREDTPEEAEEVVAENSTNQAPSLTVPQQLQQQIEETPDEVLLEEEPTEKPELTEKEKIEKAANVLRKRIERKRKNKSVGFAKEIEDIVADTKTTLVNIKYQNLHPESATEKQVNGNALIETVMHPLDNRRKALALFGTPAVIVIVYDAYKTYCSSLAAHHKKLTIREFVMDLLKNPTKNMLFTGTIYGLVAGQLIFGIKDLVSSTQG